MITTHPQVMTRERMITALSRICREWQEASQDESLLEIEAPVGLLLADVIKALQLSQEETAQVLGAELYAELSLMLINPGDNGDIVHRNG